MPGRMLRYLTDILLNYPGEAVFQYLLYIGKSALTMPDKIQTEQLQYCYTVIDMHDMDYHFFISQNSPDAIVMALLCDIKEMDIKAVVHEILTKLTAMLKNDNKKLREYLSMLEILASNRNMNLDIQQEFKMLQVEIEKLPSFMMGQEKGIEKGIAAGERKKALMIAKQLIKKNLSLEEIAQLTGLEIAELNALAQE
jgi:predicted transposase YdaD